MNVFVLSTGRAGTVTFARACSHLTNYTSAHESRWGRLGDERLDYPADHIESDNRLCWHLGRLDERFGRDAFYVHMVRDAEATARSLLRRRRRKLSILHAYAHAMVVRDDVDLELGVDYCDTVNSNIRLFLRDKPNVMEIRLEQVRDRFPEFLDRIGAEGDLEAAAAEWDVRHNRGRRPPLYRRIIDRIRFGR